MKRLSFLFAGVFILAGITLHAQEARFVALSLYNFTKFFDWPEKHKDGDFIIGVVGNSQVFSELVEIANGKSVGVQKIVVRNFRNVEEVTDSHILYLAENQSRRVEQALVRISDSAPLIVTHSEGATNFGSAINFVVRNETMRFELKKTNATRFGLRIHSRLDNLAIII